MYFGRNLAPRETSGAPVASRRGVSDLRRPPRRARRPSARLARRAHRERDRGDAEPRPARCARARAGSCSASARAARPRASSRTGRCSATRPRSSRAGRCSRRLGRGAGDRPGHVFAFAALRPTERRDDGLWLTGRPAQGRRGRGGLRGARGRVRRARGRRPAASSSRTSSAARRSCACSRRADDRVTDSDAFFKDWHPGAQAAGAGSGGRGHGTRRRDVDAADDRAARGASGQRAPRIRAGSRR